MNLYNIIALFSFITNVVLSTAAPIPNKYRDFNEKYQRYIFLLNNKNDVKLEQSRMNDIIQDLQDYISHSIGGEIIFNYNIINGFSFDIKKQDQTKNGDLKHQYNMLSNYLSKELAQYDFVLEKDLVIY
ncbi:uncharacterized protein HGUI_00652 [Hanseniaspora guilliermondii]|uniref:Inhibitor I9 domain-containing protein n=1 Tax=Hanseniaspora guilliermondii TaxID=56406 RepID=A0A1L0AY31_9ASCO|nr:uncharacterized protein HGUI_00652 [Hanseniaspora guilliermondii]